MLRLVWTFLRLGVLNELSYRANLFIQLFQSALELGAAIAGLAVVFTHTDELGGWRQPELLALLGVYFLVGGVIRALIQPSMQRFMEQVRLGTLDFTLTKPADAQLLVSIQQVQVWKVTDVILGFVVLGIALAQLGERVGVGTALTFGVTLLAGTAIVYSFWLILAACAFWIVRVENILEFCPQSRYQAEVDRPRRSDSHRLTHTHTLLYFR